MPRILTIALITAAALVVVALICDSDAAAGLWAIPHLNPWAARIY